MSKQPDFYKMVLRLLLMGGFVKMNKVVEAMRIIRKTRSAVDDAVRHSEEYP